MAKAVKTNVKATKAESVAIGITGAHLKATSQLLQSCLANLHVLYIKTRNFHWNVEGMSFGPLHELFEKQYKQLESTIDEVAERIRNLGFFAVGSLKGFLDIAKLKEHTQEGTPARDMIRILAEDHETQIRFLREAIDTIDEEYGDAGTADFLTDVIRAHEKTAWMLRVHLK
jgi:starvation-inducible DNA-binding protein